MPSGDKFHPELKNPKAGRVLPPELSKGRKLEMDGILRNLSWRERLLILFGGVIVARCTAFTALHPGQVTNQVDIQISSEHDPKKLVIHNRIASYLLVQVKREKGLLPGGYFCRKCNASGDYKTDGTTPANATRLVLHACPACIEPSEEKSFHYEDAHGATIGETEDVPLPTRS